MQFTVATQHLLDALTWVSRSLPSRPAVPVLAGVKLVVEHDSLHLSAFDYEQSAVDVIAVEAATDGTAVVSGRLLLDIVKALRGRDVTVTIDGNRLLLVAGTAKFHLALMPAEDYPALPASPAAIGVIPGEDLALAAAQVTVAASRDETLPVLTAVRVVIDPAEQTITLAATDRYRLALRTLPYQPTPAALTDVQDAPSEPVSLLVPARALDGYAKAMATAAEVTVGAGANGVTANLVSWAAGTRSATVSLREGDYPRVQALVLQDLTATATVPTAALIEAVRRVGLVAERSTPCRLTFEAGIVRVETGNGQDDTASEEVAVTYDGAPMSIAFNFTYLIDGLTAVRSEETQVGLVSATKPAVLRPADSAQEHFLYLIMPVRVAD